MKKLIIKFKCLDGNYNLFVENNTYSIETSIFGFENKEGIIDDYDSFLSNINKANIYSWTKENESTNIIDAVEWYVQIDDYSINGYEGSWPYNYDLLIEALEKLDYNISLFKANSNK